MQVNSKVTMDLLKPGNPGWIGAVQGDRNSRSISVELFAGDTPWQVPSDAVVSVRYRKPDHTGGCYDTLPDGSKAWSIQGHIVTVQLAPQMLTVPGTVFAQVELALQDKLLATYTVHIAVEANAAEGLEISEDYVNLRQWMNEEMDAWLEDAKNSGKLDGEPGTPAVLQSGEVSYQVGESGTEQPTGAWQNGIPAVVPGKFLWCRTVFTFNSGEPVTVYTVTRFGEDGGQSGTTVVSAVLGAAYWSESAPYVQSLWIEELNDSLRARVFPDWPDSVEQELAMVKEAAKINTCKRINHAMIFKCLEEKPNMDIPVVVEVYA